MECSSNQRGSASNEPTATANLRIRISPLIDIDTSTQVPGRDSRNLIRVLVFESVIISSPVTIWISIVGGLPAWVPVTIVVLQLVAGMAATRGTKPSANKSYAAHAPDLLHHQLTATDSGAGGVTDQPNRVTPSG
jgi:hypothetical protein